MHADSFMECEIVRTYGNKNHKSVAEMTTPATKVVSNKSVLLNVPNGQVVLQLTFNNAFVAATGIDTPYQSATGTVVLNAPSTANIYVYTYSTVGHSLVTMSSKERELGEGCDANTERSLAA